MPRQLQSPCPVVPVVPPLLPEDAPLLELLDDDEVLAPAVVLPLLDDDALPLLEEEAVDPVELLLELPVDDAALDALEPPVLAPVDADEAELPLLDADDGKTTGCGQRFGSWSPVTQ
ncbi:MAG: hypothetical protein JST54_00660 [Deltaproteobacteria bacterium]|nr:hypothetical protein [Deltaproteobacteria bacterium]